jgi:hypothetical protein
MNPIDISRHIGLEQLGRTADEVNQPDVDQALLQEAAPLSSAQALSPRAWFQFDDSQDGVNNSITLSGLSTPTDASVADIAERVVTPLLAL